MPALLATCSRCGQMEHVGPQCWPRHLAGDPVSLDPLAADKGGGYSVRSGYSQCCSSIRATRARELSTGCR